MAKPSINVGIIGTGWCGGIRAVAAAASPWVDQLHIAEIREERLKEVAALTNPVTATTDYRALLENRSIVAVMISTTPEPTHYPIAKESLLAGKHVFLEKPIAMELREADELIALAHSKHLTLTIGYSQRFNPKFALVKRSMEDGTSHGTSAGRSAAASSCRLRPWKRRTTSISCCGAWHRESRSASTPRKSARS